MDPDEWMGGGNDGERERDNYSYEDSEQFDEDDICSMGTDEGGSRRDDWDGWEGEGERRDQIPLHVPLDDLPSTSGLNAVAPVLATHQPHNDGPRVSKGVGPRVEVRAASAASTLTLTPSTGRGKGEKGENSFPSLFSISVKACARHLTFNALEHSYNHSRLYRYTLPQGEEGERLSKIRQLHNETHMIPHQILLSILECCFPESDDDIRLYCCLANGSVDEFNRGHFLYKSGSVENVMQIGFLVTADVYPYSNSTPLSPSLPFYGDDLTGGRSVDRRSKVESNRMKNEGRRGSTAVPYKVSLGIDRCRVVSCECECGVVGWCHHMVAVCLYRIHQRKEVEYRGTMWDSINELDLFKCRKLSQWLVNELPRKFIPVAQRLLDGLKDKNAEIFQSEGAPDPTDGGHEAISRWFMSGDLSEKVATALYKFCQPSPTVHCDVNLLSTPPAIASDWSLLLQPLKSKKPEGIWNLLSIARAMFKKRDANATSLLHVITDQVLASTHVLMWWLITCLEQSGRWTHSSERKSNPLMNNYEVPMLCGAALCEEIVALWRVAGLNPAMREDERRKLASIIQHYHKTTVERLCKLIDSMGARKGMDTHNNIFSLLISTTVNGDRAPLSTATLTFTQECFPGFFPALQACHLYWSPSELSALPPDATFSLDPSVSPHLPQTDGVLRRPYTVASMCTPNPHYYGYGMVESCGGNKKKKKSKKKKGSSSKKSARQQVTESLEQFDLDELESAESGQESDMPGPSSGGKKGRSSSYPYDDLDLLFAAAHSPLEGIELKLARCEALFSHGHTAAAAVRAAEIVGSMRGSLPSLVWGYGKSSTIKGDSSCSNSIPITQNKSGPRVPVGGTHSSQSFNSGPFHSTTYGGASYNKRNYKRVVAIPDGVTPFTPPFNFPMELPDRNVHSLSQRTCQAVERALILAKQLRSYPVHRHAVFRLLVDVLERPKGAMSTNQLQVKLFHLESEVLSILNQMNFDEEELKIIREEATVLARLDLYQNGRTENGERGVPPVSLALFIFNSLVTKDNLLLRAEDEDLSLGASLYVLGARHPYPETAFPMLGECLRRLRGDLALRLMKRYKDDAHKLGLILDRLLDPTSHRMYKYHKSNGVYFLGRDAILGPVIERGERPTMVDTLGYLLRKKEREEEEREDMGEKEGESSLCRRVSVGSWESGTVPVNGERSSIDESEESAGTEDRSSLSNRRSSDEGNDSSSNSLSQSGSHFPPVRVSMGGYGQRTAMGYGTGGPRGNRKTRLSPPCEAHSHYMVELAKRILVEAGGEASSSLFIHAPNNHGPHRQLLMCSFLTGLYALGLSNKASHNWTSRTYSTHSGCLSQQALSIGSAALSVMKDTWSLHFTPSEAASLADKAGYLNDPSSVDLGAELALSVLEQSHALSCTEGIRALDQCREKGHPFLEKAIAAVEEASTREEVFPEILFRAARIWADTVPRDEMPSQLTAHPPPPPSKPPPFPPSLHPQYNGVAAHPINPFYHHAAAMMQQQAAAAAVGGSVPPPLYPPPMVRQPSRGEVEGTSESASSSTSGTIPLHRSSMHLSHSAPNLNGVVGSMPPPPLPPPTLTQYDPRLDRLARAQRIGLKAMESMAKRGGEEDKKYSMHPPNAADLQWLFRLSQRMGATFVLLFCEVCCRTVHSPHLLACFVMELLKMFPNMHHGSLRLAATGYRPPQGIGQGKFRVSALSAGWQPPTADMFDRAMESAYEAVGHRLKPNRLSQTNEEEIMELLKRLRGILQPQLIRDGGHLFNEFVEHCLKQKSIKMSKTLNDLLYSHGGMQYSNYPG